MIETTRLIIVDRLLKDIPMEEFYLNLHPELKELDPAVGECRDPAFYSVFTKDTLVGGIGKHIGVCCLYNLVGSGVELGVRIFIPEYWNKGYGSEVVNALCDYAFSSFLQVTAVFAKTPVYNTRAARCYEKCGFARHSQAVLGGYEMIYMVRHREAHT